MSRSTSRDALEEIRRYLKLADKALTRLQRERLVTAESQTTGYGPSRVRAAKERAR